jgi:hypothetical protein
MLQERYRKDYLGEFVVTKSTWNKEKTQEREWINNPIENQHISGRAAIVGCGPSRESFDIKSLERHRGGLLGKKRLQTYAAEGTWHELKSNFYVTSNKEEIAEILKSDYSEDNITYSSARRCIDNPGKFYLIPYGTLLADIAIATWLAAFDGHTEIFLLGVDGVDLTGKLDSRSINDLLQVMRTYKGVRFYAVTDGASPPAEWRNCNNFSIMTYRTWFNYCDI